MISSNNIWTLRHGQSTANEAGLIVSKLEEGVKDRYSLTERGRQQACTAGNDSKVTDIPAPKQYALDGDHTASISACKVSRQRLRPQLQQDGNCAHFYCSPFSRTRSTAEECIKACQVPVRRIKVEDALRERYFGSFDLTNHNNYHRVWARDAEDATYCPDGNGESATDVAGRLKAFLARLEERHQGDDIILVSHGDTLSILWAVFNEKSLASHRSVALDTGELRQMNKIQVPGNVELSNQRRES